MSDWAKRNKEHIREYQKQYRNDPKNRERRLAQKKEWKNNNKEKHALALRRCHVRRMEHDPLYRLERNLRKRLAMALKKNSKTGSAIKDLGCSIEELKKYLESKFTEGMSWDNYGKYGWHIDHIKPLSKFDLTDLEQVKIACHYTNLQPMWWKDNLSKGKSND